MSKENREKVIIISYYFNLRDTDRAFSVLQYFKLRNFDVELICGNYDHNSKKTVNYQLDNCTEVPVIQYKKNISIKRMLSNLKFAIDVNKIIKKRSFDIAYIVSPPNVTGFLNKSTIKSKNAMLVLDIFDLYPETIPINNKIIKILVKPFFNFWAYLRNSTIRKSDVFIGSCKYYFSRLKLVEDNKYKIIPLCKNDTNREVITIPLLDDMKIVYLGALTGNYDFEGLIQILVELKKRKRSTKLFIIGDGHRKDWLLKELKRNDINFDFLGRVYDDSIKVTIFDQCHFGFNGFKDNSAIALSYKSMEYMSNGLALINSCKEDTWDLVEEQNIGINYQSNNIEDLVDRLMMLSEENIINLKNNSLNIYKKEYSYSSFCKRMDNIFYKEK